MYVEISTFAPTWLSLFMAYYTIQLMQLLVCVSSIDHTDATDVAMTTAEQGGASHQYSLGGDTCRFRHINRPIGWSIKISHYYPLISVAISYARARLRHGRRVRLSVRPSHTGIDSKLMSIYDHACSFHHRVAQGLVVWYKRLYHRSHPMATPLRLLSIGTNFDDLEGP